MLPPKRVLSVFSNFFDSKAKSKYEVVRCSWKRTADHLFSIIKYFSWLTFDMSKNTMIWYVMRKISFCLCLTVSEIRHCFYKNQNSVRVIVQQRLDDLSDTVVTNTRPHRLVMSQDISISVISPGARLILRSPLHPTYTLNVTKLVGIPSSRSCRITSTRAHF